VVRGLLPSRGQRGAVSGDRKQTTYAFVSWRVADHPPNSGITGINDYFCEAGSANVVPSPA